MGRESKPDYSVRSVELVFNILELLTCEDETRVSVSYLCDRLDISKSKAFRMLATLEQRGLVEREEGSGNYRIGLNAIALSQRILKNASIIEHAHPIMEELAKKHDEAVYMTVLKGEEVMFLDMVDCNQTVKAAPLIGQRFPLFSNAAGKVIKALESRDFEQMFRKRGRKPKQYDLGALISEMDSIRDSGVAVDCGGLGDGIISVAVAVRDYAGKVVGAITMLGPSFRMLTDRLEDEIIPSLREGAEILSAKFGHARG